MKKYISILIGAVILAAVTSQAQNPAQDVINFGSDALGGPWAAGGGFEASTSGTGAKIAFGVISYNFVTNGMNTGFSSGLIVGYDQCWAKGHTQQDSLSGGWQVGQSGKWLSFIGKTFMTNLVFSANFHQLVATPRGGNAIGAITGGSVSVDVYSWNNFHLSPTFVYDNRSGQPGYNGNFIGGAFFILHGTF